MKPVKRNQAVAKLVRNHIDELTDHQALALSYSANILASSPTTIEARCSAKLLLECYDDGGQLEGIHLANSLHYEELTVRLIWKTAEDCAGLSDDCDFSIDERNDVLKSIPWDDPANTYEEIDTALRHQDELALGEGLIDHWNSAEQVNYKRYPRRLRLFLRACVEAARKFRR